MSCSPFLCLNESIERPQTVTLECGKVAIVSTPCPGREATRRNEDSAAVLPFSGGVVLAVADGMGGAAAGDAASAAAIGALAHAVAEIDQLGILPRTAVINGFEQANQAVMALGGGAATTLAAVEIVSDTVRPYHVGDSLILVCGGRGKLKMLPIAHGPVAYGVEAGLISEAQAIHHEHRHVISNYLGSREMRIEIGSTLQLNQRDTVLVASDGLSDNLFTEEIVELSRRGRIEHALHKLNTVTLQRMRELHDGVPHKPDDLTILQFRRPSPRRVRARPVEERLEARGERLEGRLNTESTEDSEEEREGARN